MTAAGRLVARRSARDRVQLVLLVAVTAFAVSAITAAVIRLFEPSLQLAAALPALAVLGLVVFLVPVRTLPTIALAILTLFPTRLIPNDGPFNALPPLAIVMGIWVFRRVVLGQRPPGDDGAPPDLHRMGARFAVYATGLLLAAWLVISTLLAGAGETSVGWTTAFLVSVLLPLLVLDAREEARLLTRAFLVLGALVGVYLIVEMVLGRSPVYGGLATIAGGVEREFAFSVYRAHAAFSHPLFAAAFLTMPAALGIGMWLTSGRKWPLVCGALAAAGAVATVSRGSILAIGVAVGFALLISPVFIGWANIARWLQLLGLTVIGGIAVLNFGPLAERADSIESQLSAGVRERAVYVAVEAAQYSGWLGTGPGTSGVTGRLFDTIVIENSLLQLLISVGIPGVLLFLLFMAALMWQAWTQLNLGVVLAIIAYLVSISGFNSLDAVRSMHILIGFLALLAMHGTAPASARLDADRPPKATAFV